MDVNEKTGNPMGTTTDVEMMQPGAQIDPAYQQDRVPNLQVAQVAPGRWRGDECDGVSAQGITLTFFLWLFGSLLDATTTNYPVYFLPRTFFSSVTASVIVNAPCSASSLCVLKLCGRSFGTRSIRTSRDIRYSAIGLFSLVSALFSSFRMAYLLQVGTLVLHRHSKWLATSLPSYSFYPFTRESEKDTMCEVTNVIVVAAANSSVARDPAAVTSMPTVARPSGVPLVRP